MVRGWTRPLTGRKEPRLAQDYKGTKKGDYDHWEPLGRLLMPGLHRQVDEILKQRKAAREERREAGAEPTVPQEGEAEAEPTVPQEGEAEAEPNVPQGGEAEAEPTVPPGADAGAEPNIGSSLPSTSKSPEAQQHRRWFGQCFQKQGPNGCRWRWTRRSR